MTVIVALKDEKNKQIVLGADRQGTMDDICFENFGCKLLKMELLLSDESVKPLYVAVSGSSFLHSYLWNVFKAPIYDVEDNFVDYLYSSFFKELKYELMEQKLVYEDNGELDSEASLILVFGENIYNVYYNFSVVESPRLYAVGGAGHKIALSVIMNNLKFHQDMNYEKIVEEALYTTGKLNIYCNTDYDIEIIDYE